MSEVGELLQRQAHWQKSRRALSGPEKIRLAEQMHEAFKTSRAQRTASSAKTPITPQPRSTKDYTLP